MCEIDPMWLSLPSVVTYRCFGESSVFPAPIETLELKFIIKLIVITITHV